jgi:sortase (surface protein transpeptidase)
VNRSAASREHRTSRLGMTSLATVAAVVGVWLVGDGLDAPKPPPQPTIAQSVPVQPATPTPSRSATPTAAPTVPLLLAMPPSNPTRVRIPAIRVDAPLTGLSLESNHHLAAPPERERNLAGWYVNGAKPGALGTALIAGHVDNWQGPAVFYNLGALHRGDEVDVDRADGSTAVFSIDAVEAYAANAFPDQKVYGWAQRAELRIITCGAGYDKRRQEYMGNVVVYSHLTSTKHMP